MKGTFSIDEAFVRDLVKVAIEHDKQVKLSYIDKKGDAENRIVEPIECKEKNFSAWCQLREGFRYFTYDRVLRIVLTDYNRTKELEEK